MSGRVSSVERALDILELVARRSRGAAHSEICRSLEIPKSSATYLLRTLEEKRYLQRDDETGLYRIGLRVLGLSQAAVAGLDLRRLARPILERLADETGLTTHAAILDHGRAVYVERAENPGFIKINTWVGRDVPVHSTSVGKVLVAHAPPRLADEIIERMGLEKRTPKTIVEPSHFAAELERVRNQGYAVDDEENNLGVRCLAVAVFDQRGRVCAALGVSGATSQIRSDQMPALARRLDSAARTLSRQIGFGSEGEGPDDED